MARKQYGVAVEVEDSKRELVMGGESGSGSGSGNRVPLAVAESRCLHIFIHSFQRQRLPTIAKLWNA